MPTRSERIAQWVKLIAAVGVAIPALVASVLSFMAYVQSQDNSAKLDRAAVEQTATAGEVEKVHTIVNAQRTAMEKEIHWLKDRVIAMHGELVKLGERSGQALPMLEDPTP